VDIKHSKRSNVGYVCIAHFRRSNVDR
jgi:hypothetical protein